jgi:hypothetical protein
MPSRDLGFAITTDPPTKLNEPAKGILAVNCQSPNNLGWLEDFEMMIVGMGGGFADASSPRSKSPNLVSDFSVINDDQQTSHDYGRLDEYPYLRNDGTSNSAFLSSTMSGFNDTSDFDFDLNPLPSIPA